MSVAWAAAASIFPRSKVFRRKRTLLAGLLSAFASLAAVEARADACPTPKDEIATDRPDVTNSSIVVPVGSLQSENGVNVSSRDGGRTIDGRHPTWRLGIDACLELLVDVTTCFATIRGAASSGVCDVAPAVKWQVSPIPGKIDLSLVFGMALPTGAVDIAGRGAQPYLQMPWSWELHDGWGLSGMLTEFFRPSELTPNRIPEAPFALAKKLTTRLTLL